MKRLRLPFIIGLLLLAACGNKGPADGTSVTFVFGLRAYPGTELFRIKSNSPAFIATARQQLGLPVEQRKLFPAGTLAAGNGGHNQGWSWHLIRVEMTEAAIELCDGRPSEIEANLKYWLETVKGYCPWDAYVISEEPS